jgi:hypothetical protein
MNTVKELESFLEGAEFIKYLSVWQHGVLVFIKPRSNALYNVQDDFLQIRLNRDAGRIGLDIEVTPRRKKVDESTGLTTDKLECGRTERYFIKCTRKTHEKLLENFDIIKRFKGL